MLKFLEILTIIIFIVFLVMAFIAFLRKGNSVYKNDKLQQNPMEGKKVKFVLDDKDNENADGKKGHLQVIGESNYKQTFYGKYVKRFLDIILSFFGLVILAPVYLTLCLAIIIDDPGPVFFTQKRVGKNKRYFKLHKFRSMKMCTPHDVPTHMLENPEQYITKVGKFIRAHSLDELPQIWDIFIGNMSFIGPRPGLWNQDVLISERDKYGANDIKPGLTGWAQINGRDEIKLIKKAQYDGEYAKNISFRFDLKCFFLTIKKVFHDDSIVEGSLKKKQIKVLFLANHFITLYSFRKELIKKLIDENYEVYLSLPDDDQNKYFEDLGCKIIITEIDRRGINPFKDLKLLRFYKRIMNLIKPDIIFSYTIKPNIYGTIASNKKFRQVCNITGTGATFLKNNIIAKICKVLYKNSIKKCYKIFFQNTGDKDFFIENKLVSNNYDMLPGSGCNLDEYRFVDMPDDKILRFIFIGRVMHLKGIDEFLESAKRIKEKYSNVEFIIAGWNEEEKYKSIIKEYESKNIVKYIGFRKDIKEWITKCHCTILPSHGGEGIPNVLLESAAIGRVCIGSKINGTKDVISDGKTGYLFDVSNVDDLVEKIEKFIHLTTKERIQMGIAGRKKIEKEFDRNIVIKKYMDEIKKIENFKNEEE